MVTPALFAVALATAPGPEHYFEKLYGAEVEVTMQHVTQQLTLSGKAALLWKEHHSLVRSAKELLANESAYSTATEDSAAGARAAFAPMCATKLEEIADKWAPEGSVRARGASALQLGHSLGTHFQVQCEHGLPMDEPECDELAAQLQVTVAHGAPFHCDGCTSNSTNETAALIHIQRILPDEEEKEALVAQTTAESTDPAGVEPLGSVEEWCAVLFDSFFAEILASQEEADGAEEEAAALLGHTLVHSKTSLRKIRRAEEADAWQPMRNLLEKEAVLLVKLARNASGNSSGPLYGKALHEADEAAKAAKEAVYAAAKDGDAATAKEAFLPECAKTLSEVADRYLGNGLRGAEMTLGLSMATHLQVQCHDGIPIEEEKCDEFASELLKLLDAGNPILKPTPPPPPPNATNGTNGTNATDEAVEEAEEEAPAEEAALFKATAEAVKTGFRSDKIRKALAASEKVVAGAEVLRAGNSSNSTGPPEPMAHGEEWCGAFFDAMLEGIIADVAAAAEEGAEGEEGGEEAAAEEEAAFLVRKDKAGKPKRK